MRSFLRSREKSPLSFLVERGVFEAALLVRRALLMGGPYTIHAPRTQHNACALRGEKPGRCLAQPAARARDDDDLAFDSL